MDPLKYMMNKTMLNARVGKWIMFLMEFDLEFINHKSIKGIVIANQLLEESQQNNIPLHIELLDCNLFGVFDIEEEVE